MTSIDDWFVARRQESIDANSPGQQLVNEVEGEQKAEEDNAAKQHVDSLFTGNKLINGNVLKEDYNFTEMVKEQGPISAEGDGLRIPNKFRTPLKQEVAGYDIGTGRQERKTLKDVNGIAKNAVELLRQSSVNINGEQPPEDSFPLSQIAYQALEEGHDYEKFKQLTGNYSLPIQQYSYSVAERVKDIEAYRDYVNCNVWNTKDNPFILPPEKYKHSDLVKTPEWINSARAFFERAYGSTKKDLSDDEINKQALWHMSQWNNNLTTQSIWATRIANSEDEELKKAFYNMMVIYDRIDTSGVKSEYFSRGAQSVISDPLFYAMGGLGAVLYKKLMAGSVGARAFGPVLMTSISVAPEGYLYGGFQELNKQVVEKEAGAREELDPMKITRASAEGGAMATGGAFLIGNAFDAAKLGVKGTVNGGNAIVNRIKEVNKNTNHFPMPGSLTRQRGSLSPYGQQELFEFPKVADPFYSRMEKSIETSISKKGGTGEQILARIRGLAKKGEFKSEELEWSGLVERLEAEPNKVWSKEEVLNTLRANNFSLRERRLAGDIGEAEPEYLSIYDDFNENVLDDESMWDYRIDDIKDELEEYHGFDVEYHRERYDREYGEESGVDWEDYLDDVKEDEARRIAKDQYFDEPEYEYYNDSLEISVRGNDGVGYQVIDDRGRPYNHRGMYSLNDVEQWINENFHDELMERAMRDVDVPAGFDGPSKFKQYALEGGDNYREILFEATGDKAKTFKGGHFEQEDIVFHARVQDFETEKGKTLFIDEVQSDWHNKGKEVGYLGPELDKKINKAQANLEKANADIVGANWDNIEADYFKNQTKIDDAIASVTAKFIEDNKAVPGPILDLVKGNPYDIDHVIKAIRDFPTFSKALPKKIFTDYGEFSKRLSAYIVKQQNENFLSQSTRAINAAPFKDDYPVIALRRLIREAADGNYKSVSWTTSQTQVERWHESTRKLYELVYDQKMVSEANRIGKKYGVQVNKIKVETDYGPVEVWNLDLTPSLIYKARHEGFPLFQLLMTGGGAAGAASQMEPKEQSAND